MISSGFRYEKNFILYEKNSDFLIIHQLAGQKKFLANVSKSSTNSPGVFAIIKNTGSHNPCKMKGVSCTKSNSKK